MRWGSDPSGAARRARDRTTLDVGEARQGKLVGRVGEARLDTLQVKARVSEVLHVIMLMALVQVKAFVLLVVEVVLKVFVVEVEEVLLFSLSSTPLPRTTPSTAPAGRCLGLGR